MSNTLPVPHPVFEDRQGQPWYRWKDTLVPPSTADLYSGRKRLTHAELAAVYWMSSSRRERLLGYKDGYWSATDSAAEEEARRMNIIHRFATLPHYDEPQR